MLHLVFRLACVLPVLTLVACRDTAPADLRVESVQALTLSAVPGAWPAVQRKQDAKPDQIRLLKVDFSSTHDLVKLAKANTLHLSYRAYSCGPGGREGAAQFVLSALRIGDYSASDGAAATLSDLERFRQADGRLTYHVLVPLAGAELARLSKGVAVTGQVPYFNPGVVRADLCLQLSAAAMWTGAALGTNIVRVPAAQILGAMY